MAKPTYEELERRVHELERLLGDFIDQGMDNQEEELYELSILYNISQVLASTRDLDELLAIVIEEVNKALLCEGSGVLLYDETRDDLYWRVVRDARGILAPQTEVMRLPMHGSIAGWVFRNNKPARVNDTSKDKRYYPGLSAKTGFPIKKVLQVPLNTTEKTIGVLMAMNKIGGDFSPQDEALQMSMAATIALAIENATVYEKLKKSRDDLEMIYNSSMALATTMDLDHLLEVVVDELTGCLEAEAGGVLLYDERSDELYWREIQDEQGVLDRKAPRLRLPLDKSISGRVFNSGEPALLNKPAEDPLFFGEFEVRSGFRIRNEIIVPLNTREETIGVLVVLNKKEGAFTEADVHLCTSLAGVVAMAVENAAFFEELLKSYRELEELNRVKSKILNHLSHELRTPLSIIRGSLATMEKKLQQKGVTDFDRQLARIKRHVTSLNTLEAQVESIMMSGYTWERRMITEFLDKALTLMEVQAERTPEIQEAAGMIHAWLDKTFPTRRDEAHRINVKGFIEEEAERITAKAEQVGRKVAVELDLADSCEILIPEEVLSAIVEGLIRNAIEATPDNGRVLVGGEARRDRYIFRVKDWGVGIPDKEQRLVFEGFYPVQETENYSSGRPYSFNAGGKGIDLLRIRMFSELYGFKISFTSKRCAHIDQESNHLPGDTTVCTNLETPGSCEESGGSEFVVDFACADSAETGRQSRDAH
jgi:GAF domain-containing protein